MNVRFSPFFQLRHPIVALVLILVLLGLHSFTATNQSSSAATQQQAGTISITQAGFLPHHLTIQAGQEVVLMVVNQDSRPHNFAIEELGIHTATLKPGESAALVLPTTIAKGRYTYVSNPAGLPEAGYHGMLIMR